VVGVASPAVLLERATGEHHREEGQGQIPEQTLRVGRRHGAVNRDARSVGDPDQQREEQQGDRPPRHPEPVIHGLHRQIPDALSPVLPVDQEDGGEQ